MKKRHSEEQIIRILRVAETHQVPIRDKCEQHYRERVSFATCSPARAMYCCSILMVS